jgi:hypothetical protein
VSRDEIVKQAIAKVSARIAQETGLAVGSPELAALVKLSAEVVDRVVREVVPALTEQIKNEHAASRRS